MCSIEPDEGREIVRGAPGLTLVEEALHLPTLGGGDGSLALLRRPE